jgi:succinate dehydrogenase/fumarate reductase iron-sulfur protein
MTDNEFVRAKIFRFAPDIDDAPRYETFEVSHEPNMRVLDVLERIIHEQGQSLAYRWFCGVKKCGACGVQVNGRPVLACWEPAEPEMVIEPLPNHQIVRDLVVDRQDFDARTMSLDPLLKRKEPYPGFPEPLTATEMAPAAEMMDCIECLLCTSMCPAYGEKFAGPAALVQLAKTALDPRDGGPRAGTAYEVGHIAECVSCYECTQACPTDIRVLEHAIDGLRRQIVAQDIGDVAHHHHVYRDLTVRQGLVSPVTLMLRSKGWRVLSELPHAIVLVIRGRLLLKGLIDGLLNRNRMRNVEELDVIARALQEDQT